MRIYPILLLFLAASSSLWGQEALLPVTQNGKWGYINGTGEVVVQPQFDAAALFEGNVPYAKVVKNGRYGLINRFGKMILPTEYNDIKPISDYFLAVRQDTQWSLRTLTGEIVMAEQVDDVYNIGNSLLVYRQGDSLGMLNKKGDILLPAQYNHITWSRYGLIQLRKGEQLGLTDEAGKLLLPATQVAINILDRRLVAYQASTGWGVIDRSGQTVAEPEWEQVSKMGNEFLKLLKDERWQLLNLESGSLIAGENFRDFRYSHEDKFIFYSDKGLGIVDAAGKVWLQPNYEQIVRESDLYKVQVNGRWGLVSNSGNELVQPQFNEIRDFINNVALVRQENRWGLINRKGDIITPLDNDQIRVFDNLAKIYKGEAVTIVEFDDNGNQLSNDTYTSVMTLRVNSRANYDSKKLRASSSGSGSPNWYFEPRSQKWGLKDPQGRIRIAPKYDDVRNANGQFYSRVFIRRSVGCNSIRNASLSFPSLSGVVSDTLFKEVVAPVYVKIFLDDSLSPVYNSYRGINTYGNYSIVRAGDVARGGFTYIGPFADGLARFCIGGKLAVVPKGQGRALMPLIDFQNETGGIWSIKGFPNISWNKLQVVCTDGKWGYMDRSGRVVVKPGYEYAEDFKDHRAIVKAGGYWGVITPAQTPIIDFAYDEINLLSDDDSAMFQVSRNLRGFGFIDPKGKVIASARFQKVYPFTNGFARVKMNGRTGFIDANGNPVTEVKFEDAQDFHEGLAAVRINGKWGYINDSGQMAIKPIYRRAGNFSDGLAPVYESKRFQYINHNGRIVIQAQFRVARDFTNGYAWAREDLEYGLINHQGDWVIWPRYRRVEDVASDGTAIVKRKKGYGLVSSQGETIIPDRYRKITRIEGGKYLAQKRQGSYSIYDRSGQRIKIKKVSRVYGFSEGLSAYRNSNKSGYLNLAGEKVIPVEFGTCYPFSEGYAIRRNYKGYSLIDSFGRMLLPPQPQELITVTQNLILTQQGRNYIFLHLDGSRAFPDIFSQAFPFTNNVARVADKDGKWTLLTPEGFMLFPPRYEWIGEFSEGLAPIQLSWFHGIADRNGVFKLGPEYEALTCVSPGLYRVEQNNAVGYIREDGNWLWPVQW